MKFGIFDFGCRFGYRRGAECVGFCRRGFPGLLYFLRFAGVARAVARLTPAYIMSPHKGLGEFGEPAVRGENDESLRADASQIS